MVLRTRIKQSERGLWFKHGNFQRPLVAGVHWFPSSLWGAKNMVQTLGLTEPRLQHPLIDLLVANAELRVQLEVIELSAEQRAIVWKDGRLADILGPGRHAYWKSPYRIEVERFDVSNPRLDHPRLEAILQNSVAPAYFDAVNVDAGEIVLLFIKGTLSGRLPEGRHAFWKGGGQVRFRAVDAREQVAEVAGQEIMTSDKVTLRVNLVVSYQITNAEKAVLVVTDAAQALYREAQLILRAAVGTRKLDDLLADKESVGSEVRDTLAKRASDFGVSVRSVGLRDIILPGEMKTILNRVIEAQKSAEAEIIKRREETASARSQANTAKLLAENPILARMKELELLQGILAGTNATFVLGAGDITDQVKSLVAAPKASP